MLDTYFMKSGSYALSSKSVSTPLSLKFAKYTYTQKKERSSYQV